MQLELAARARMILEDITTPGQKRKRIDELTGKTIPGSSIYKF
jgi:hypothetical protein